jgi:hypothetical protein
MQTAAAQSLGFFLRSFASLLDFVCFQTPQSDQNLVLAVPSIPRLIIYYLYHAHHCSMRVRLDRRTCYHKVFN